MAGAAPEPGDATPAQLPLAVQLRGQPGGEKPHAGRNAVDDVSGPGPAGAAAQAEFLLPLAFRRLSFAFGRGRLLEAAVAHVAAQALGRVGVELAGVLQVG